MQAEWEIRRTLAEYCHCIDDGRTEALADLFTRDICFVTPWDVYKGREEVRRAIAKSYSPSTAGKHCTFNSVVDVRGDEAAVTSDFVYFAPGGVPPAAATIALAGRYADRLVREEGRWRIAHREIVVDERWLPRRTRA